MLPDLLTFNDGSPVTSAANWPRRREELFSSGILDLQYGGLPREFELAEAEILCTSAPIPRLHKAQKVSIRVDCADLGEGFSFHLTLYQPPGEGPFPVILSGDGCWAYMSDEVLSSFLQAGIAYAEFNRCEIAHDHLPNGRAGGIYDWQRGEDFGALSAWAWGYHRSVDVLVQIPDIDASRIAITGHSRGGKAALLAGATDERVLLTQANGSGCGGAASHKIWHEGSERLADMRGPFRHWFGPRIWDFCGREGELPFDQHFLKALIAPRALLCTEAREDLWANPEGSRLSSEAARPVFELLGAGDRLFYHLREGKHTMHAEDWEQLRLTALQVFGEIRHRELTGHCHMRNAV